MAGESVGRTVVSIGGQAPHRPLAGLRFNGEKIRYGGESGGGVPRQRQSTPPPVLFPLPFPGEIGEIGKIGQDS